MATNSNRTRSLAATLPDLVREKGWERKFDQHRVFPVWESLVDDITAAHSWPLKVVRDVLWLEVENSAWMQQLQYQKVHLLDTLNDFLKVSRFSDIRFTVEEKKKEDLRRPEKSVRFVPPPAGEVERFTRQISFIEDERIRDSLMRLWYLAHACRKE